MQGWAVTSLAPDDPGFMPTRYWRGPIWPILNWASERPRPVRVPRPRAQVRRALIDLSSGSGFWEHYSPLTGGGKGRRAVRMDCGARPRRPGHGTGEGKEGTPVNGGQTDTSAGAAHRTNGGSEMDDVQDNGLDWEQTFDRRSLLGKAAVAGGVLAAGGLLTSRASAGVGRQRQGHGLLRPVRRHRRAGGHPEVRLQGLRRRRRCGVRADHRSTQFVDRVRARRRPARARSTCSSVSTGLRRSRTKGSSRRRRRPARRSRPSAGAREARKLGTRPSTTCRTRRRRT